jgi:hypothetical protein
MLTNGDLVQVINSRNNLHQQMGVVIHAYTKDEITYVQIMLPHGLISTTFPESWVKKIQ